MTRPIVTLPALVLTVVALTIFFLVAVALVAVVFLIFLYFRSHLPAHVRNLNATGSVLHQVLLPIHTLSIYGRRQHIYKGELGVVVNGSWR